MAGTSRAARPSNDAEPSALMSAVRGRGSDPRRHHEHVVARDVDCRYIPAGDKPSEPAGCSTSWSTCSRMPATVVRISASCAVGWRHRVRPGWRRDAEFVACSQNRPTASDKLFRLRGVTCSGYALRPASRMPAMRRYVSDGLHRQTTIDFWLAPTRRACHHELRLRARGDKGRMARCRLAGPYPRGNTRSNPNERSTSNSLRLAKHGRPARCGDHSRRQCGSNRG